MTEFLIVFISVVIIASIAWRLFSRRRPDEGGFKYVYVNQDGTVRELAPGEVEFLCKEFYPGDSGRPYIKLNYRSKDGWGSLSGFILRRNVPRHIKIEPVNPNYKGDEKLGVDDIIHDSLAAGDIVTHNEDGSVSIKPNPNLSPEERLAKAKEQQINRQAAMENAARFPKI